LGYFTLKDHLELKKYNVIKHKKFKFNDLSIAIKLKFEQKLLTSMEVINARRLMVTYYYLFGKTKNPKNVICSLQKQLNIKNFIFSQK
jgi:hypothetical protein